MESCIGCTVNNNTMSNNPYRGIWMDSGFNTTITNNTMDVDYLGIEVKDGSYYILSGNTVTINNINNNSGCKGVYFNSSEYCTINNNTITITNYTHKWIANGKKHPLVEARVNSLGGTVISAEYQAGGAVVINTASTDVSCSGMCDGEITVTPTIGISPYSYQWDDPSAQSTAK